MENINISEEKHFFDLLKKDAKVLKLVYFYTEDSEECKQMSDVFTELYKSSNYSNVSFIKIDASKFAEVSKEYDVSSVPSFLFHMNSSVVDRLIGANAPALLKKLNEQVEKLQKNAEPDLTDKLKHLINQAPCMLFMKGNPDTPRCGFSKQVIALLEGHGAKYETFDILQDMTVREGLKKYSNWPTYPQLYINGELLGGVDILKELSESGELDDLLPKAADLNTRLKELINKAPVMVFMKGSPLNPLCGFSKNLIVMLNETGVKYETFDILEDNSVREGLKKFSNWPTYPQVYVKGDLIGGFDIIKEMHESGELKSSLEGN